MYLGTVKKGLTVMGRRFAICLVLALSTGALNPGSGRELPRRFGGLEAVLEKQFATRAESAERLVSVESVSQKKEKRSRKRLYLAAALTLGVGCFAQWSKHQADTAYDRYLYSANQVRQDREFARAERFDRISGAAFVSMEIGVVLNSYLLFFRR